MSVLKLPALEVQQGKGRKVYSFAVDGKVVPQFASITRLRRNTPEEVSGYQRPEVVKHVAEIRRYLESENPMIPNSIVVAFDDRVKFVPEANGKSDQIGVRRGEIVIPLLNGGSPNGSSGWIVDGQQRLAAIGQANLNSFPILVSAFIAQDIEEQRSQFILVNSTKPLPKGLIYELLPLSSGMLPTRWATKQFPAELMLHLNNDEHSPFFGLIKTPTNPTGLIQDNSILRMIENSLRDGILFSYSLPSDHSPQKQSILDILNRYWSVVARVFSDSWAKPPRQSRLMHGVGIVSMGYLMDNIITRIGEEMEHDSKIIEAELSLVSSKCSWSSGWWDFGGGVRRRWNELQNTNRDIQLLTNYILKEYRLNSAQNRL